MYGKQGSSSNLTPAGVRFELEQWVGPTEERTYQSTPAGRLGHTLKNQWVGWAYPESQPCIYDMLLFYTCFLKQFSILLQNIFQAFIVDFGSCISWFTPLIQARLVFS